MQRDIPDDIEAMVGPELDQRIMRVGVVGKNIISELSLDFSAPRQLLAAGTTELLHARATVLRHAACLLCGPRFVAWIAASMIAQRLSVLSSSEFRDSYYIATRQRRSYCRVGTYSRKTHCPARAEGLTKLNRMTRPMATAIQKASAHRYVFLMAGPISSRILCLPLSMTPKKSR
jgi:hypothetical protein